MSLAVQAFNISISEQTVRNPDWPFVVDLSFTVGVQADLCVQYPKPTWDQSLR